MAKVVTENQADTQAQQNAGAATGSQTGSQSTFTGSQSVVENMNSVFGGVGDNSRAGQFVSFLKTRFEEQRKAGRSVDYFVGTVPVNSNMLSIAYMGVMYNSQPIYTLAVFESGSSVIGYTDANGRNQVTTILREVDKQFKELKQFINGRIKQDTGLTVEPTFINMALFPAVTQLNETTAGHLAQQMVVSIEARGNRLGELNLTNGYQLGYQFEDMRASSVADINGVAQRANWKLDVAFASVNTNQQQQPLALLSGNDTQLPGAVRAIGYVNTRYVGLAQNSANLQAYDPERWSQLCAEMTITQIDASSTDPRYTIERSLAALAGVAKSAGRGGWNVYLQKDLTDRIKKGQKISKLTQQLKVDGDPKLFPHAEMDKNPQQAIQLFYASTAAVVMRYRRGDGIGGLASLLSEILYGDMGSLAILERKLNKMFGSDAAPTPFTNAMQAAFGRGMQTTDVVAYGVPHICGTYNGSNGVASTDDIDIIELANAYNIQSQDFYNYVKMAAYQNRPMGPEQCFEAQKAMIENLRTGNDPHIYGDGLDLCLNPTFLSVLSTLMFGNNTNTNINGIVDYDPSAQSLGSSSVRLNVGNGNGGAGDSSIGANHMSSGFNFLG